MIPNVHIRGRAWPALAFLDEHLFLIRSRSKAIKRLFYRPPSILGFDGVKQRPARDISVNSDTWVAGRPAEFGRGRSQGRAPMVTLSRDLHFTFLAIP